MRLPCPGFKCERVTNIQGKKKNARRFNLGGRVPEQVELHPRALCAACRQTRSGDGGNQSRASLLFSLPPPLFFVLFMTLWSYAKEINRFKQKKNRFGGETVLRARFHQKRRSNRHPPIKNIRLRRRRHSFKRRRTATREEATASGETRHWPLLLEVGSDNGSDTNRLREDKVK